MFKIFSLIILIFLSYSSSIAKTKKSDINPAEVGLYLLNQTSEKDMIEICKSLGMTQLQQSSNDFSKNEFIFPDGTTIVFNFSSYCPIVVISTKTRYSRKRIVQFLQDLHFQKVDSKSSNEIIYMNGSNYSPVRTECRISSRSICFSKINQPFINTDKAEENL